MYIHIQQYVMFAMKFGVDFAVICRQRSFLKTSDGRRGSRRATKHGSQRYDSVRQIRVMFSSGFPRGRWRVRSVIGEHEREEVHEGPRQARDGGAASRNRLSSRSRKHGAGKLQLPRISPFQGPSYCKKTLAGSPLWEALFSRSDCQATDTLLTSIQTPGRSNLF